MPSRVIREGILDSQRYWSVGIEARQLFVHLMLLADDFGLVSLAPVFIRRRCFDDAPTPAKIDKLLEQLHDADLVRIYTDGDGPLAARYGFIPRFGQRMRQWRAKHPMPPEGLYSSDETARRLFKEHKHLFEKSPAGRRQVGDKSRPEVDLEEKRKGSGSEDRAQSWKPQEKTVYEWARELGLQQTPEEHTGSFQVRVYEAVRNHKAKVGSP